jgi:NAD(P)-dependent dehydrogenase (short-subunit alcohol dehydrogenase family)
MGRFDGKVALITGAARGQGRNHALRFAREGADVIVLDMCRDMGSVPYSLASRVELDEVVESVKEIGTRAYAAVVDVRDLDGMTTAVADGVATLWSSPKRHGGT